MGKIKLYMAVAGCAFVAGLLVLFVPKSWFGDVANTFSFAISTVEKPTLKKTSLDEQMQKFIPYQDKVALKVKKEKKPAVPQPYIPGQVQESPPVVFNEIMVKTALSFAYKVGSCTKKTCPQIIDPSTEQWRIYAKVITDSKNACARRQLDACVIHSNILVAEKRYIDAVEVAKLGFESAQSVVSRCDKGKAPNSAKCIDARAKMNMFSNRIRDLNKALLQAH